MKRSKNRPKGGEANGWKCTRCEAWINPKTFKWLELSLTDGNYYEVLPEGHKSQGSFPFGADCAKIVLDENRGKAVAYVAK